MSNHSPLNEIPCLNTKAICCFAWFMYFLTASSSSKGLRTPSIASHLGRASLGLSTELATGTYSERSRPLLNKLTPTSSACIGSTWLSSRSTATGALDETISETTARNSSKSATRHSGVTWLTSASPVCSSPSGSGCASSLDPVPPSFSGSSSILRIIDLNPIFLKKAEMDCLSNPSILSDSTSISTGTSLRISTSSLLSLASSAFSASAFLALFGVTSSTRSMAVSRSPKSCMILRAVFSPIPGTPGTLSEESPMSALTSTSCFGSSPYFSRITSRSYSSRSVTPFLVMSTDTLSDVSWSASLSPVTMTTGNPSGPSETLAAKVPITSSASKPSFS